MTESKETSFKERGVSKRKFDDEQGGVELSSPKSEKKQKTAKPPKKPKLRPGEDFDDQHKLNLAIGRMVPEELVKYVDSRTKQFEPKISEMELEDQRIPGKDYPPASKMVRLMLVIAEVIRDTTSWEDVRVLDSFADFLEKFADDLKKVPKEAGSPHTIVVAGAGLRAADITRSVFIMSASLIDCD
jgi:protein CMS1